MEPAVELACKVADDLSVARERYRVTQDPVDGRMARVFAQSLSGMLRELGFSPSARARLGVQTVKAVSKLEALRRKPS